MKNLSAVLLLASGILLAYISLFLPPPGKIDETVIYIFAQILIYAGSIFGIEHYISLRLDNRQQTTDNGHHAVDILMKTDNSLKEKTMEVFPKPTN